MTVTKNYRNIYKDRGGLRGNNTKFVSRFGAQEHSEEDGQSMSISNDRVAGPKQR